LRDQIDPFARPVAVFPATSIEAPNRSNTPSASRAEVLSSLWCEVTFYSAVDDMRGIFLSTKPPSLAFLF
jgi:hypothetical protein